MSHVFFFSYASVNVDPELEAFIDDLRREVAPGTEWKANDPRICFRDRQNLGLMDDYEKEILDALQTSTVFVCLNSPAYFSSRFCGQEYSVFEQRYLRIPEPARPKTGLILPIIWAPVEGDAPTDRIQWQPPDMPASSREIYEKRGLRYLKRRDPSAYEAYVTEFGVAISDAWKQQHSTPLPKIADLKSIKDVPNRFAGGRWEEAVGSDGSWLAGPGVVAFVFAAGSDRDHDLGTVITRLAGRYGEDSSEWRPYLPPRPETIAEIARAAAKRHSMKYREISVNSQLVQELENASARRNLTVVIADPLSLHLQRCRPAVGFDRLPWEGAAALILPLDQTAGTWDTASREAARFAFPIFSQLQSPQFHAPVLTVSELEARLDDALNGLRIAVTKTGAAAKGKSDSAPAQISATGIAA